MCESLQGTQRDRNLYLYYNSIQRILKSASLRKTKLTYNCRLTKKIKAKRLAKYLKHQYQTLKDSKDNIQSNKPSVVLLHRRSRYRNQRTKDKAFVRSCIREQQKGASKLIFWATLRTMKKACLTIKNLKLHKKNVISSERLSCLISRLNLFYRSNQSLKRG